MTEKRERIPYFCIMMKKLVLLSSVFLILAVFAPDLSAQCSQCKLLAEQSGGAIDDVILGTDGKNNINTAILYIMAVPYIILTVLFRKQIARLFRTVVRKA
jgi:hypothetical protein